MKPINKVERLFRDKTASSTSPRVLYKVKVDMQRYMHNWGSNIKGWKHK